MPHHFIARLTEGGGPAPPDELRHLIEEARRSPGSTAWLGMKKPGSLWRPTPGHSPSVVLAIHVEPTGRVAAVLAKVVGRRSLVPEVASVRDFYGTSGVSMKSWWEIIEPLSLTFPSLDQIPGHSMGGLRAWEAFRGPLSFAYWDFDVYDLLVTRVISPGPSTAEVGGGRTASWPPEAGLPGFLAFDAHGDVHLNGHRVSLFQVLSLHREGADAAEIQEEFPTLGGPLIEETLDYFRANRAALEGYLDRYREALDRREISAHGGPDLAELTRREQARRRAGVR